MELAANLPRAHQTRRQQHINASACINSAQAGRDTSPSLGRISPTASPCLLKSRASGYWLLSGKRSSLAGSLASICRIFVDVDDI